MDGRSRVVAGAGVAFVAIGVSLAFGSSAHRLARATTQRPIVRGYAYARRCPAAGFRDAVDRWGMNTCNCTSYVAWALAANGQRTDWFIRGAMDAFNWPSVARRRGIPTGARPRVRAVAVWPRLARPFGHVAYVTKVEPDGSFDVAEYNLPRAAHGARFAFDVRTDVSRRGATFVYVPRRTAR
jgi:surface antigen